MPNQSKNLFNNSAPVKQGRSLRRGDELYENEKENAKLLIEKLTNSFRWGNLLAPMQSGKTMIYFLTGAEMIRLGKVAECVIFSGTADKELKKQVEESKKVFLKKYENYLINDIGLDESEAFSLCDPYDDTTKSLFYKIKIVWSADSTRYSEDPRNKIFVWEESHFAQDKKMRPGEFLRKLEICPTGNREQLEKLDSYVLSVSATPFSEICAKEQYQQEKSIVKSKPGKGYYGLYEMISANKINSFGEDPLEGIKTALKFHYDSEKPSFAFVRLTDKVSIEEVKAIAKEEGWLVEQYDSKNKGIQLNDDIDKCSISILRRAPAKPTLILLKGMYRMGKNLIKTHISFVMEMAKDSNADVVLQGLLGRMCGYQTTDVTIYLHEQVIQREHVEKYIEFMSDYSNTLPSKCRNLAIELASKTELNTVIPVKVHISNATSMSSEELRNATNDCFQRGNVSDLNQEDQTQEIRFQVCDPRTEFTIKNLKRDNKTYEKVPEKISVSRREEECVNLGSGCGIKAGTLNDDEYQITLFVAHEDYEEHGIKCGDVFLDARTRCGRRKDRKTSGLEVFSGLGEAKAEAEAESELISVQMLEKTTTITQMLMKTTTNKGVKITKIGKPRRKVKLVVIEG